MWLKSVHSRSAGGETSRSRRVTSGCRRRQVEKGQNVFRGNAVQIARHGTEAESHEALKNGLALTDRCFPQPLLMTHPVAVRGAQLFHGLRRRKWRKQGKPRPPVSTCSCSAPISRHIAVSCLFDGDQVVDIRLPKISFTASKNGTAHTPLQE